MTEEQGEDTGKECRDTEDADMNQNSFELYADMEKLKSKENLDIFSSRVIEKRKEREDPEEDSSIDGFTTILRRKSKRLIRSNSGDPKISVSHDLEILENAEEENYEISVTSLKILPKQMAMAKLLRSENIHNISRIKYKSPFKIFIQFRNKDDAEKLLKCKKFEELDYRCQETYNASKSFGFIRGVDLDFGEEEILAEIKSDKKIISIKRLRRVNDKGKWVDSESVRICFGDLILPDYVFAYGLRFKVEPFIFPVTQCGGCWKFGHMTKFCPTKKVLCPKCGSTDHNNCTIKEFKCLNCKGPHLVLDKSCPIFRREREIRTTMSQSHVTYKKALEMIRNNTWSERDMLTKDSTGAVAEKKKETQVQQRKLYSNAVKESSDNIDSSIESDVEEQSKVYGSIQKNKNKRNRAKHRKISNKLKEKQRSEQNMECEEVTKLFGVESKSRNEERDISQSDNEVQEKFDIVSFLCKIHSLLMSEKSFEEKVSNIIKYIVKACRKWFCEMMSSGKLLDKVTSFFNNYGSKSSR